METLSSDFTGGFSPGKGAAMISLRAMHPSEIVPLPGGCRVLPEQTDHTVTSPTGLQLLNPHLACVNHSCRPNAMVGWLRKEPVLIILRDILPNEEITIDYAWTEPVCNAVPLGTCQCGSHYCRGGSLGYTRIPTGWFLEMLTHHAFSKPLPDTWSTLT